MPTVLVALPKAMQCQTSSVRMSTMTLKWAHTQSYQDWQAGSSWGGGRGSLLYKYTLYNSVRVHTYCMHHVPTCTYLLHASCTYMYILTACIMYLHVHTYCMHHVPTCTYLLHASCTYMYILTACIMYLHVHTYCMHHVPTCTYTLPPFQAHLTPWMG